MFIFLNKGNRYFKFFAKYISPWPWGQLSLNENEYQGSSWVVMRSQYMRLITPLPYVSQLSRKCDSLDALQPYGPL
jgi:hypothetical protein